MKHFILLSLFVSSAFANEITGQPVLRGSLRSKLTVNGIEVTCRAKVEKIRNILEEDAWGNPGYQVRMKVELDGEDRARRIRVKHAREHVFINMYEENGRRRVRDYDYFSPDNARLKIHEDGRLREVSFPFEQRTITCLF